MKDQLLVLIEVLVHQKKSLVLISKANTKFFLSLHYNSNNSYLFVNGKEVYQFKASNKNVSFPTQLFLGSISIKLGAIDSEEASLKGNVFVFSVAYNSIDKSNIFKLHKYLMIKNNI